MEFEVNNFKIASSLSGIETRFFMSEPYDGR
jgi:hypothetical protein